MVSLLVTVATHPGSQKERQNEMDIPRRLRSLEPSLSGPL